MNLKYILIISTFLFVACQQNDQAKVKEVQKNIKPAYALVIHGGAGFATPESMDEPSQLKYTKALNQALSVGENILKKGGSSLDAVEKTINFLENSPLFNAGKGAVYNHDGHIEMDASIMNGKDQNAGAVGGVTTIKNPVSAARSVMENSVHVMMTGKGAEQFASNQKITLVDPSYFHTVKSWNTLQKVLESEKKKSKLPYSIEKNKKHGTVGCVALDNNGNLAAGTSTGGMTNKKYNRIGDSPIIGAGTYADNASCAVSSTGHGEYFIRYTVARDIAAMMEYGQKSLVESAEYIINEKLVKKGGAGGVIALDKDGNISMPFNTTSMFRGYVKPDEREVKLF